MKYRVRCTFEIDVETNVKNPFFAIEDNGCPGNGIVGAALREVMDQAKKSGTCWACALQGENKIIAINGVDIEQNEDRDE